MLRHASESSDSRSGPARLSTPHPFVAISAVPTDMRQPTAAVDDQLDVASDANGDPPTLLDADVDLALRNVGAGLSGWQFRIDVRRLFHAYQRKEAQRACGCVRCCHALRGEVPPVAALTCPSGASGVALRGHTSTCTTPLVHTMGTSRQRAQPAAVEDLAICDDWSLPLHFSDDGKSIGDDACPKSLQVRTLSDSSNAAGRAVSDVTAATDPEHRRSAWDAGQDNLPPPPPRTGNPYSWDWRSYRDSVRRLLALAEESVGHDVRAGFVRGCEKAEWLYDKEEPRSPIHNDQDQPVHRFTTCDHRLCPLCSWRRIRDLKGKLVPSIAERFKCKKPAFVTFTIDDRVGESLYSAYLRAAKAFGKLRRRKSWKALVNGGFSCVEVTRNHVRGSWHVHIHAVIDTEWFSQAHLLEEWRACLGATGLKIGGARIERAQGTVEKCVDEAVKYVVKGIDAIATYSLEEMQELLNWMSGRRLLATFGNLYGLKLGEDETPSVQTNEDDVGHNSVTGEIRPLLSCWWRRDDAASEAGWHQFERTFALALRITGPPSAAPS